MCTQQQVKIFLVILGLTITNGAYAYLDPGTGSIILQGLIAGIVGFLFVIKLYWMKFKRFLIKLKCKLLGQPVPEFEEEKSLLDDDDDNDEQDGKKKEQD